MSWLVLSIYAFEVSKKSDFLLEHGVENHVKPNYIITLKEIKKTKGGERLKKTRKANFLPEVTKKKKLQTQIKLWGGGLISIYVPNFMKISLMPNYITYHCFHFASKWHVLTDLVWPGLFDKRLRFTEPYRFMNVIEFITTWKFRSLTWKAPLIQTPYQLAPSINKN